MNNDLKIIKKKYGEKMMHLCRDLFPTILDNSPGILSNILLEVFEPHHFLYDDLQKEDLLSDFKSYIYRIYDDYNEHQITNKQFVDSPKDLLKQVGYTLFECLTEEDIQKFKKYYAHGEELCTFTTNRLKYCHVFFAVKDNADKLNRQDFSNPHRQDEYGTSVISIQFSKDNSHILSIKNRYNHTVPNPDATFSNNLDNIVPGLTQSFANYYGMIQINQQHQPFEIPGYVRANDGKFYKYNYEINNVYYCPNNIIIDNFRVIKYDKEKYLVMDYFILDLTNKKIQLRHDDSFPNTIGPIKNIKIINEDDGKLITITPEEGEDITITLDKSNRIISYKNNNVLAICNDFLSYNEVLKELSLEKVIHLGSYFLYSNKELSTLSLPNAINIGYATLVKSQLTSINLPNVVTIDDRFLENNNRLTEINLPSVVKIGDDFITENQIISSVNLPNVTSIGYGFLSWNQTLKKISLPKAKEIGGSFCSNNKKIHTIELPEVENIGGYFLSQNENLTKVDFPKVISIKENFLQHNNKVTIVSLPNLEELGTQALLRNYNIHSFYAPKLESQLDNNDIKRIWYLSSFPEQRAKKRSR